jgi:hypothetical protein
MLALYILAAAFVAGMCAAGIIIVSYEVYCIIMEKWDRR